MKTLQLQKMTDSKEGDCKDFREYSSAPEHVRESYRKARVNQTVEFVKMCKKKYCTFGERKDDFWTIFDQYGQLVDKSDPDLDSGPNSWHAYQTAEGMRTSGMPEWMVFTGFIHDMGKVLYVIGCDEDGTSEDQQWATVGDTFIVGCDIPKTVVYPEFNKLNPDLKIPERSTKYGIYGSKDDKEAVGLNNVLFSFGHDEFLYQLLKHNKVKLPEEAWYMIRFHSCYLWHMEGAYKHFMSEKDKEMLPWVQKFQKFDLYTKRLFEPDWNVLKPYYRKLVKKYLPNCWECLEW